MSTVGGLRFDHLVEASSKASDPGKYTLAWSERFLVKAASSLFAGHLPPSQSGVPGLPAAARVDHAAKAVKDPTESRILNQVVW